MAWKIKPKKTLYTSRGFQKYPQNYFGFSIGADAFHVGCDSCQVLSGKMIWPRVFSRGTNSWRNAWAVCFVLKHITVLSVTPRWSLCCCPVVLLWDTYEISGKPSKSNWFSTENYVPQSICTLFPPKHFNQQTLQPHTGNVCWACAISDKHTRRWSLGSTDRNVWTEIHFHKNIKLL